MAFSFKNLFKRGKKSEELPEKKQEGESLEPVQQKLNEYGVPFDDWKFFDSDDDENDLAADITQSDALTLDDEAMADISDIGIDGDGDFSDFLPIDGENVDDPLKKYLEDKNAADIDPQNFSPTTGDFKAKNYEQMPQQEQSFAAFAPPEAAEGPKEAKQDEIPLATSNAEKIETANADKDAFAESARHVTDILDNFDEKTKAAAQDDIFAEEPKSEATDAKEHIAETHELEAPTEKAQEAAQVVEQNSEENADFLEEIPVDAEAFSANSEENAQTEPQVSEKTQSCEGAAANSFDEWDASCTQNFASAYDFIHADSDGERNDISFSFVEFGKIARLFERLEEMSEAAEIEAQTEFEATGYKAKFDALKQIFLCKGGFVGEKEFAAKAEKFIEGEQKIPDRREAIKYMKAMVDCIGDADIAKGLSAKISALAQKC